MSQRTSVTLLLILTATVALIFLLLPRIPQPQAYHLFADRRSLLGIPNFGDVASNLPFAVIGIWGLIFLLRSGSNEATGRFLEQGERWPYLFVFVGLLLTAFGSSYYHLSPNNSRLVWDRLPMTIAFMSVNPVIKTLRQNGIEVTALHSHMLMENPRLFFMHFWANADAIKLAKGLRAALDQYYPGKMNTETPSAMTALAEPAKVSLTQLRRIFPAIGRVPGSAAPLPWPDTCSKISLTNAVGFAKKTIWMAWLWRNSHPALWPLNWRCTSATSTHACSGQQRSA